MPADTAFPITFTSCDLVGKPLKRRSQEAQLQRCSTDEEGPQDNEEASLLPAWQVTLILLHTIYLPVFPCQQLFLT